MRFPCFLASPTFRCATEILIIKASPFLIGLYLCNRLFYIANPTTYTLLLPLQAYHTCIPSIRLSSSFTEIDAWNRTGTQREPIRGVRLPSLHVKDDCHSLLQTPPSYESVRESRFSRGLATTTICRRR